MLALCTVFISSDLIAIRPAGFTLRPAEAFMVAAILLSLPEALGGLDFRWPVGFGKLVVWTVFVLIFVPNTPYLLRSIGYAGWLLLDVALVFSAVQVVDSPSRLRFVLRWYALSFGAIAAFGLLQFFLPLMGLHPPLVRDWWARGRLARVNGISYEPSFFAGYMAVGWVFVTSLTGLRSTLFRRRTLWLLVALTSTVLVVCGSRSGWAIMLGWVAWKLLGRFRKRPLYALAMAAVVLIPSALYVTRNAWLAAGTIRPFLAGTGLMNTASFTVTDRVERFENTLRVFWDSPFVGVSLGGVIPAIGALHGRLVVYQTEAKAPFDQSEGTTAEVLAATGVFGFPFYVLYIVGLIHKPLKLCQGRPELRALLNSFIVAMVVMQMQMTITQGYVWVHIAILSACYSVLQRTAVRRAGPGLALGSAVR